MTEDKQKLSPQDVIEKLLGMGMQVMAKSPLYASKSVKDAYESLIPALVTKQHYFVCNDNGEAVAFISWALVSDEVELKLSSGGNLGISDWQSGENGIIIDVVSKNFQASTLLVNKVKQEIFTDKPLKALSVSKDNTPELKEVLPVTIQ